MEVENKEYTELGVEGAQNAAEKTEKWGFWEKEHGLENKLSILGLAVQLLIIYGELQISCAVDSETTLQTLWGANTGL